jgi:hypothetical protein
MCDSRNLWELFHPVWTTKFANELPAIVVLSLLSGESKLIYIGIVFVLALCPERPTNSRTGWPFRSLYRSVLRCAV